MDLSKINIQRIEAFWLKPNKLTLDVLRLDVMHPQISGNKWFKLKYYIEQAKANSKHTIATFGGAWSNHIAATAFAAKEAGLKSVGIIRGERPAILSETLISAIENNMKPIFVPREQYQNKEALINAYAGEDWFWIDEGGYGIPGLKGAADILNSVNTSDYKYIISSVGTGTTLAGLVLSSLAAHKVIGINSMKGNASLSGQVNKLLPAQLQDNFTIFHDYHFGGYAKHPPELIDFINAVYHNHQLPLDIIYTGKTFYAIQDLVHKSYFKKGSSILMIHTGGLQGNKSLPGKVLAF